MSESYKFLSDRPLSADDELLAPKFGHKQIAETLSSPLRPSVALAKEAAPEPHGTNLVKRPGSSFVCVGNQDSEIKTDKNPIFISELR